MDPEDYPSDSDASDEDFRPDKAEDDSASEVYSDDNLEGHDAEDDGEETGGGRKRKQISKKTGTKKAKLQDTIKEGNKESTPGEDLDDEDEERLTDALWADFLSGTGNSNGSTSSTSKQSAPAKSEVPRKSTAIAEPQKALSKPEKTSTVTKIFEFAGEAVEVTEEIPKNQADQSAKPVGKLALGASNGNAGPAKPPFGGRPSGGGLGAVLSQIGKKNKLSTLEKTKLDWNSFKRTQGIEEELQTHNKGKDGYLERQDFLQRADVRQFEIEKSFRQTSRSNR